MKTKSEPNFDEPGHIGRFKFKGNRECCDEKDCWNLAYAKNRLTSVSWMLECRKHWRMYR